MRPFECVEIKWDEINFDESMMAMAMLGPLGYHSRPNKRSKTRSKYSKETVCLKSKL